MPISRIFQPIALASDIEVSLTEQAVHHLARVLRVSKGDEIILFNGQGGEYQAVISHVDKKSIKAMLGQHNPREAESSLELYLAQGISRGERMDYTIQKAVELGVKKIIPLFTERCNVKLDEERREKRLQHWQAIVTGACEQSGRNRVPEMVAPQAFDKWVSKAEADFSFVLSPHETGVLSQYPIQSSAKVILLIGPEGGLSDAEVNLARGHGFKSLNLGPRILRTETAAVAAIVALQSRFGDMS